MTLTVRQANEHDVPAVVHCARVLHDVTGLKKYGDFDTDYVEFIAGRLIADDAASLVLLALEGAVPIGAAIVSLQSFPFAPLQHANEWLFWVDPLFRKRGIASAFVEAIEKWASAKGARFLILSEMAGHEGMSQFSQAVGFRPFQSMFVREVL